MIKEYHDYFDIPVVTAVFGWEKHGSWIGPDYFPPNPNKQFYLDLVKKLDERGDNLHFYTSGFRWGVKKPINEKGLEPRIYTDYDGTASFMERDRNFAVTDKNGEMVLRKPRWADNYMMCTGSEGARRILDSCYNYIYDLGVAGLTLTRTWAERLTIVIMSCMGIRKEQVYGRPGQWSNSFQKSHQTI